MSSRFPKKSWVSLRSTQPTYYQMNVMAATRVASMGKEKEFATVRCVWAGLLSQNLLIARSPTQGWGCPAGCDSAGCVLLCSCACERSDKV